MQGLSEKVESLSHPSCLPWPAWPVPGYCHCLIFLLPLSVCYNSSSNFNWWLHPMLEAEISLKSAVKQGSPGSVPNLKDVGCVPPDNPLAFLRPSWLQGAYSFPAPLRHPSLLLSRAVCAPSGHGESYSLIPVQGILVPCWLE